MLNVLFSILRPRSFRECSRLQATLCFCFERSRSNHETEGAGAPSVGRLGGTPPYQCCAGSLAVKAEALGAELASVHSERENAALRAVLADTGIMKEATRRSVFSICVLVLSFMALLCAS